MMPSGHKAFIVNNVNDVELLLMHNRTHAAEYVSPRNTTWSCRDHHGTAQGRLLTRSQDRPRRLREEEGRHHQPREAAGRQGHQPQGEGHDGGINVTQVSRYGADGAFNFRKPDGARMTTTGMEEGGGKGKKYGIVILVRQCFFKRGEVFFFMLRASECIFGNKRFALRFSERGRWLRKDVVARK